MAAPYVVHNRGMTLGGPNLEVTLSSPLKNIIKVSVVHFKGSKNNHPSFELNTDKNFIPVINDNEEYTEIISGDTRAVIKKGPVWDIQYYYKDGLSRKMTDLYFQSSVKHKMTFNLQDTITVS